MLIIAGKSHATLTEQISNIIGCELIIANTEKFANQELKVRIGKNLSGCDVIILQSTNDPVNDNLMELLLLADTAKGVGCNTLTAIVPYFGYSRQDRIAYQYSSISASLVAKIIETSGIDKIITVDIHSKNLENFFKIKFRNIDPTDLFIDKFKKSENSIVVAPDVGSIPRAKLLALKLGTDFAIINKSRNHDGKCIMSDIIGDVAEKNCIVIDDIVDTGGTLCEAFKLLIKNGASSISACITHGVFSKDCIQNLEQIKFKKFLVTDTICNRNLPSFIEIIPIAGLIAEALTS